MFEPSCDASYAEHVRYVYNLQESSSASSEGEDEEPWDSDDTANSWRRQQNGTSSRRPNKPPRMTANSTSGNAEELAANGKRMSLLTNCYFDVPVQKNGFAHYDCGAVLGKATKRKFFSYSHKWDDGSGGLTMRDVFSPLSKTLNLAGLMERGGRDREAETMDDDWDDNNSC